MDVESALQLVERHDQRIRDNANHEFEPQLTRFDHLFGDTQLSGKRNLQVFDDKRTPDTGSLNKKMDPVVGSTSNETESDVKPDRELFTI